MTEVINEELQQEVIEPEKQNEEVAEGEGTEATAVETAGEVAETPDEKVAREEKEEKKRKQLELQTKEDLLRRIDKITKDKYDLLEREEHWKRKALERGQEQQKTTEVIPEDVKPARPNPKNFPDELGNVDFDAYTAALDAHEEQVEQWKERQRQKTEAQTKTQREAVQMKQSYKQSVVDLATELKMDIEEVEERIRDESVPYTDITAHLVLNSTMPAKIALYLSSNKDFAEKLTQMPPARAAMEIGKLEDKLSQKPVSVKKISGAPDPLNIVNGKDTVRKNPSDMPDDEWFKWEEAERLKKIKQRYGG